MFVVAIRRGKQFNGMVQERRDALTGQGDAMVLTSAAGELTGARTPDYNVVVRLTRT